MDKCFFRTDSLINDRKEYTKNILLKLCSTPHTIKFKIEKNSVLPLLCHQRLKISLHVLKKVYSSGKRHFHIYLIK